MTAILEFNSWLNEFCYFNLLDVISVIVSGLALIFAVLIPVRIANHQNKIALFEKRFSAYSDLKKLSNFSLFLGNQTLGFSDESREIKKLEKSFYNEQMRELILSYFSSSFDVELTFKEEKREQYRKIYSALDGIENSVQMLPFLYGKCLKKYNNYVMLKTELIEVTLALRRFISNLEWNENFDDQSRIDFINHMSKIDQEYMWFFKEQLKL